MTRKTAATRKTSSRRPQRRPRRKAATGRSASAKARAKRTAVPVDVVDIEDIDAPALPPLDLAPLVPPASVEEGLVAELPPDFPLAAPEPQYAARMAPPPPERPAPEGRRAIFFDVENSSHAPSIERVIQRLAIDRGSSRTDFVAVGNWRVIGLDTGRLLARLGAQLIHSAPATGVRDWSDLRIAVSAGVWLAGARPGDVIEIVSDDRAFDAIGDVAATLGIRFHRLSYRALSGAPEAEPREEAPPARGHRRGRGRRRGSSGSGRGSSGHPSPGDRAMDRRPHGQAPRSAPPAPAPAPAPVPAAAPAHAAASEGEPHTAPHDEIVSVVQDLVARTSGRPVLIDALARELKARGFARPAGSPRLITRLRRIRELSVSPTGMITLIAASQGTRPAPVEIEPADVAPPAVEEQPLMTTDYEEEEPGDAVGNVAPPPGAPQPATPARRPSRGPHHRRRRGGGGRDRTPAPA